MFYDMEGKIIIFSAPSGSGKSTIINRLIPNGSLSLGFSISATSRKPRGDEKHGKEYYFLTEEEFRRKADAGDFVEWEEVYQGVCYGTLESEVKRITGGGKNLVMDVDVKGALNIKKRYGSRALSIFIMPPDKRTLEKRLRNRGTDSEEVIEKRLRKSEYEMSFAPEFDKIVVNDNLDDAVLEAEKLIMDFISEE